jgi:predicted aldo/keto reductase-like oxidoreductase
MIYRILGKTGMKVSVIGFGGIPIQRISKNEAVKLLHESEGYGINFVDTARGYTVSENYIGDAMKGRRSSWIIATKSLARNEESMMEDVHESLKNLKTDYIDLYQFHNIRTKEEYDKVFGESGAYRALEKAQKEGKVRHIGITTHNVDVLEIALEDNKVETAMSPYNIIENQADDVFEKAIGKEIGTIAMKPLAGGMIKDPLLAIKYVLSNNNITVALPGMASIQELEQNTNCIRGDLTLDENDRIGIAKIVNELGNEFCRRCGYCAPCTQGIDIPTMFLLQGYKERYDLAGWAEDRYLKNKSRAKDCIGCGDCEKRCPYNLPIIELLKRVKDVFND